MRLYKPKYKDKKGKTKQVEKWWLEFRDPNGIVQRWGLGTTDQDVAEITKSQISSLNEWAKKRLDPPEDLVKWVRRQDDKLRNKIYSAGLLKAEQANATRPLSEHLADYIRYLQRKNNGSVYPTEVESIIKRIVAGCGFKFWSDIEGIKIEEYIGGLIENGISRHTGQHNICCFRYFANWLKRQGRINETPILTSIKYKVPEQRAFEPDEWKQLLKTTREGSVVYKLTGHERYVLYRLAVETGLRRDELRSLTQLSFNFENCTVFVSGEHTKNGQDALQDITPDTAQLVKDLASNKTPNTRIFKITSQSAIMLRIDCKAAGIETTNHRGTIKFHSLRHSCGTFLAASGVHPKKVQEIMRHSDINITMGLYTHILRGGKKEAVRDTFSNLEQEKKEQSA